MPAAGDFLSCDWGTTSFRLRWVSGADGSVLREIREPVGVRGLYEEAMRLGAGSQKARGEVFAEFLGRKLQEIKVERIDKSMPPPLVISGMASSSVGWREVPYAAVPFPLTVSGMRSEVLAWAGPEWLGPTYLIAGVATGHDMMRGEESEAIGIMAAPELKDYRERSLLVLPGTHSKHIQIDGGCIVDIRTFITGELFEVLGRHSLLRASVELASAGQGQVSPVSGANRAAFEEGVRWAREHGLAGGLFRVRTRAVLGQRLLAENTWFFSGLLIGAELGAIPKEEPARPLVLGGARAHAELYQLALEAMGDSRRWIAVPPEQVEHATVQAHALFLRHGSGSFPLRAPEPV